MLAAIEITTFYDLTKAYHQSLGTRRNSGQFLFLARFFASSHFGSISESVVVVGDPEHDRLGRPVFHGISKRTHVLSPPSEMKRTLKLGAGTVDGSACRIGSDIAAACDAAAP
jgi:hypothetical protein